MDQDKIGKFIAECRKEKSFTQAALAEQLGITDRAVSKWERGKNMPDLSIMPDLCELLGISVNELLTGEHIEMEDYRNTAEQNLLELTKKEMLNNKKLLSLEKVIGYTSTVSFMLLIFSASFAVDDVKWRVGMILMGSIILAIGMVYCLRIEHDAGYYQCPNCGWRYVPSMKAVFLAPHMGLSRKMTCPHCGKRGYHKKVLTK